MKNEKDLHIYCVRLLELNNIKNMHVHSEYFFKDKKIFYKQLSSAKNMGYSNGFPDLMVFLKNRVVFIEFKNPNGKGIISDSQKEWHKILQNLEFELYIVSDVEKFKEIFKIKEG